MLSILIPARNEMFLNNTIEDILKNSEAKILVGLDGYIPEKPIAQNPRVNVIYYPQSIGQRAITNRLCAIAKTKYVMKVDAHCSFDKDFDKKMLEAFQEVGDNATIVPIMRNLHAFDWVCECGHREYQSPTRPCPECGKGMKREIKWIGKPSPQSTSYKLSPQLEFGYFGEYKKQQKGDLVETMSLQGSCFMLTKDRYLKLNICDESLGSWGGQGAEVALKTWLSGGRVLCNKKTWYAHLFRTQGGDFGFPYPNPGADQKKAKDNLRKIFLNDKWDKAVRPLSWLVNKFNPPGWDINKGIIFYTDNQLNLKIAHKVQKQLKRISKDRNIPIVSSSLKPMPHFGKNIHIKMKRGREAYYTQILAALRASTADIIYFCEHDVLYHPSHFNFIPLEKDKFYFNINVWKTDGKRAYRVDDCKQVSGMVCYRETAIKFYENINKNSKHYEPRENRVGFESELPNIDIRHNNNFTKTRWSPDEFINKKYAKGWTEAQEIPGWGNINNIL